MYTQMPAGRELDALVAERVMGWSRVTQPHELCGAGDEPYGLEPIGGGYARGAVVPHYSTDIAAAWQVVERLRGQGCRFHLYTYSCFEAQFLYDQGQTVEIGRAIAAPLAICLAALAGRRT